MFHVCVCVGCQWNARTVSSPSAAVQLLTSSMPVASVVHSSASSAPLELQSCIQHVLGSGETPIERPHSSSPAAATAVQRAVDSSSASWRQSTVNGSCHFLAYPSPALELDGIAAAAVVRAGPPAISDMERV